ncbi:hypothetical protein GQ457_12G016300 [Hibiscus cannabinus]
MFGGETLEEPSHEILYEESRLNDDSSLMESMGNGVMSGPNDERQNIATAKDNPPLVGVDGQRVTINVFNTLKYADDFRECQQLQDVESMMANKEPAEFSCSNFSQIEDYLKLEDEDNNEIKEYQREVQQSSIIIARPGTQGIKLDKDEMLQHFRKDPHPTHDPLSQLSFFHMRKYLISGHRYAAAFLGALEDKTRKRQKLKIYCSPHVTPHQLAVPLILKLGFLVASREGRQASGSRQLLRPLQAVELADGVTTLTHFRDKDRVSMNKKSRT